MFFHYLDRRRPEDGSQGQISTIRMGEEVEMESSEVFRLDKLAVRGFFSGHFWNPYGIFSVENYSRSQPITSYTLLRIT